MIDAAPRQSTRFLLLYALAVAGGAVAYVPFLTVLLPVKVSTLAGVADVRWLAFVTLSGASVASIANIAFGWLSDHTGTRRLWIALGMGVSGGVLVAMRSADSFNQLVLMIVAWQIGLNMMLAPLAAWAGDCVPDRQKGLLGGLLALAPALGAAAGAFVTIPGFADADMRLVVVALLVVIMVVPVLVFGKPVPMPHLMQPQAPRKREGRALALKSNRAVGRMWLARLLIQIAEAALFAFLLFWFRSIDERMGDSETARIFSMVVAIAVPVAIFVGRWSDRTDRPIFPLMASAAFSALGLAVMAFAGTLAVAIAGYVAFGVAAAVFLSLHTSQTLRVLPLPQHRGRDLGVFNLTNTLPSLIMPWLTLVLVPGFGFAGLFWLLAGLALAASLLLIGLTRFPGLSAN